MKHIKNFRPLALAAILVVTGIAAAVCGLVMVLNPFGTIEGLVMFVGLGFLVDGVTTLVNTILLERLQR